jgi:benzoyl-CoA reductase subunit C
MISEKLRGLEKAEYIYNNREERAKSLKDEGFEVMGYYCSHPPLEILTAMDFVPFRIQGCSHEPITKADSKIPTVVCPILRSCLDLGLKGTYDFLTGLVAAHSCDCEEKLSRIWGNEIPCDFQYFIDLPHVIRSNSFEQFKDKLLHFKKALEEFTGRELTTERLREEIARHNRQRALVRELYSLKKEAPPLLSGSETLQVTLALMCLPIEEGSQMLQEIIEEVKTRSDNPVEKDFRLMLWGSPLTETNFLDMIEDLGAYVVMDDFCVGSRHFWPDVEPTDDPLDGLAKRYLEDIKCPRTFRESAGDFKDDMEHRFAYLIEFAKEWGVDGVVLETVQYCDTHGYEVPGLKRFFEERGFPTLYLEHEYTSMAEAQLKNRIEAFLEVLESE